MDESKKNILRRLYDWVLSLADQKQGVFYLFLIAFAESSFFPIPPDVLLIALVLGNSKKFLRFALICTLGSVLGGCFGYWLGTLGQGFAENLLLNWIHVPLKTYNSVKLGFQGEYGIWMVAMAGFTPIPYKVFTITSGILALSLPKFVLASFFSRGARFLIVAVLMHYFGPKMKNLIDKYFNWISLIFFILLVAGFYAIKMI